MGGELWFVTIIAISILPGLLPDTKDISLMNAPLQTPQADSQERSPRVTRRMALLIASYGAFLIGAVMALIPFGKSFAPSRRAVAVGAPIDVDLSNMQPGELRIVQWRGKPVWIVRRSEEMIASLSRVTDLLADPDSQQSDQPDYAANQARARKDEWLVMLGLCTHLGCSPLYRPENAVHDLGENWQGGFFCPCHGSRFDLSGRVFKNAPAPTNMPVPEYAFIDETTIRIGVSEGVAA